MLAPPDRVGVATNRIGGDRSQANSRFVSSEAKMGRRTDLLSVVVLMGSLLPGCSTSDEGASLDELAVDCAGKCDGFDSIVSLVRDPAELDLSDLVEVGLPLGLDAFNDLLSTDVLGVEVHQPAVHNEEELDQLVDGLVTRFGERELTTEVNALRRQHLADSSDTTYAEVGVTIDASVAPGWTLDAEGFEDASVPLGFDAGVELGARFVTAFAFAPDDPLGDVKALRGYTVPRSLDDLREMKPGESVSLRGRGTLGANLGVGVPLLVAEPVSFLSYSVVLTAALRARMTGTLDVQLVRLDEGRLVIDVGLEDARVKSARVAIEDGWGAQGLELLELDIGGVDVDLGKLAGNALSNLLNRKLSLVSAHAERTSSSVRASVARFRIDLDAADPRVLEATLSQLVRGDLRLAQALSNRGEPGIAAEFDLLRSGVSVASSAGIEILGMSWFKKAIDAEGSVVFQSPGGVQTLLFDSLHRERAWLWATHAYTRVGLAGLTFDGVNPPAGATNLFFQVQEGDEAMERDKLVDHLDSVIVSVAGLDALLAIEGEANAMERYVQGLCPNAKVNDSCVTQAVHDPELPGMRARAMASFGSAIEHVPGSLRELLVAAAEHKLQAQATFEIQKNGFIGPSSSLVLDFRLDDAALANLAFETSGLDLSQRLLDGLRATEVRRHEDVDDIDDDRRDLFGDTQEDRDRIAQRFDAFTDTYQRLVAAEAAVIETVGEVGSRTLEVRFPVDASQRPLYEQAVTRSLARARSAAVTAMIDDLIVAADDLGPAPEQVVAYGLLASVPADHLDVRLDIEHELGDTIGAWRKPYREAEYPERIDVFVQGNAVEPIDGGLFDVDALVFAEEPE